MEFHTNSTQVFGYYFSLNIAAVTYTVTKCSVIRIIMFPTSDTVQRINYIIIIIYNYYKSYYYYYQYY